MQYSIMCCPAGFAGGAPKKEDSGLCYIGLAMSGQKTKVQTVKAPGDSPNDRVKHKEYIAKKALQMVKNHL